MGYERRPHFAGVNLHWAEGIRFKDGCYETGARWLQIQFLDARGCCKQDLGVFYGDTLEPEDVRAAMREYLGLPAEVKPETDSERAAREPTGLMVD